MNKIKNNQQQRPAPTPAAPNPDVKDPEVKTELTTSESDKPDHETPKQDDNTTSEDTTNSEDAPKSEGSDLNMSELEKLPELPAETIKPAQEVINQVNITEMIAPVTLPAAPEVPKYPEVDLFGTKPSLTCSSMMHVLDNYIDDMDGSKYRPMQTILQKQCSLSHLYKTWLNLEDINDFLQFGEYLIEKITTHRESVFSPTLINRGYTDISLSAKERSATALVNSLLYNVTGSDRSLGYVQCGNFEGSLAKYYGDQQGRRLALYLQKICNVN